MLLTGIFHFYIVNDHLINSREKYNFQNANFCNNSNFSRDNLFLI